MPTPSPLAPYYNLPAYYIPAEDLNMLLVAVYIKSLAAKDTRKVEVYYLQIERQAEVYAAIIARLNAPTIG
jgi:hypothetical protein